MILAGPLWGYALVLALAGPAILTRARWTSRAPMWGVLAWQSLVVSIIAATVLGALALVIPSDHYRDGIAHLLRACTTALTARFGPSDAIAAWFGLAVAGTIVGSLTVATLATMLVTARARRRHQAALDLVAVRAAHPAMRLLPDSRVIGYCLPGRAPRVVISTGAVATLRADELNAVVQHELAHLRGRHHLLVIAALIPRRAFGGIRVFAQAHREVARLVELRADDVAARSCGRPALARAIVRMATAATPAAEVLSSSGGSVVQRARRMAGPTLGLGVGGQGVATISILAPVVLPIVLLAVPLAGVFSATSCPLT
ncbi:MAG TPA: M56 family metallopeptidase [Gemmatimonadaceae bacterium]|nr:M56 family metallopeptidase [Gemmatimonadaceae bacterium]